MWCHYGHWAMVFRVLGDFYVSLGHFRWSTIVSPWRQLQKRTRWWKKKKKKQDSTFTPTSRKSFRGYGFNSRSIESLLNRRTVGPSSTESVSTLDDPVKAPTLEVAGSHLGWSRSSVSNRILSKRCRPIPEQQVPNFYQYSLGFSSGLRS